MSSRAIGLCAWVSLLFASTVAAQSKPVKVDLSERNRTQGISGLASSAQHCVGNTSTSTGVHVLGAVPNGTRLTVTFSSNFDPVASVVFIQMGRIAPDGRARISYVFDDDGGGNLEPEIRFTTTFDSIAVLNVSRYESGNSSACYFYKAEIQTP